MTLTLLVLVAFGIGVVLGRLSGWLFVLKALGALIWSMGYVLIVYGENARLRHALDSEEERRSEALRRAQVELASQVGTRRL